MKKLVCSFSIYNQMQNSENNHHHHHHSHSDTERFNIPGDAPPVANSGDDYVEITLNVRGDSVAVVSVKEAGGGEVEDPDVALVARGLEKRSSFGSSVVRNASSTIRQVSQEFKRLASLSRRPHPAGRFDRTKSAAAHALKFISKTDGCAAWDGVEERFHRITEKTNGLLHRARFGECIGMNEKSKEFAGELFDALARRMHRAGGSINKAQLKEYWTLITDQSFDSRLQIFFDMVDKDADGRITEEEVREIITLSASANQLSNIQKQADEYARLIMEELDPNEQGYILIENLKMLLLQGESQSVRGEGEKRNLSKMLSQKLKPTEDHLIKRWYRGLHYFLLDNWQRVWVMALWIGVMVALFTYKYIQYKNREAFEVMGHCVCMAKGAAETLKLNMALILLPVCRNTITWLRNKTKLGVAVPFDDNLNFHKVIAIAIAMGVGIHGISHLACDFPRLLSATPDEYEDMERFFGEQPRSYWFFIKGWEGVTGIVMVVLMAIAFTLATPPLRRAKISLPKPFNKKKLEMPLNKLEKQLNKLTRPLDKLEKTLNKHTGFNTFWYSHHLFVIVYACLIIHGIKLYFTKEWYKKTTWMYLAVPVTLYACERLIRALRSSIKAVKILKVAVFPGNVLTLHMSKPQGFNYKSGQYIFVNCAAVSRFEWHPFSITSAPRDEYVSVHIRADGDWTEQLKKVFTEVCEPSPRVLIDGPYGAPTQDYKSYDIVLLVGLGIGATPMISVVKDIINNMKAVNEEENAMEEGLVLATPNRSSGSGSGQHNFKTRRAYFYWVTRESGFDWFKGVMNEVGEMDHKGVIEMHSYCSSVYEEGDARSALITMLQSLNHAKNGVDVVSGTRVKSHFAKPNWRSVYKRIALNHPNSRVGVFYCGAPQPVEELRQLASDFSHRTNTKFEFHKENF